MAHGCNTNTLGSERFCTKHRKRYTKEHNTARYYYDILVSNAHRRGKEITLTIEEFKQFCAETNYLELKGKKPKSLSIDRIDPAKGYTYSNIQVLSLADNSAKRWSDEPSF